MITTDAWVLYAGPELDKTRGPVAGELRRETFTFSDLENDEILVEPLYGSWEANLDHALSRNPIDIVRQRREEKIVLGNGALVRVLERGRSVKSLREGDVCMAMPFGKRDENGFAELVYAYDAPGTIGVMARRTKMRADNVVPLPSNSRHSLLRWTTYGRYFTAWDNWKVASACWRAQLPYANPENYLVFGWGGGTTLAELQLAKREGFRVAMTASNDARLKEIAELGIIPVDRRLFPNLSFDEQRYKTDAEYREAYKASEQIFADTIDELSGGKGVAIFLDNLGGALYRATMRVIGRTGIIATVGWKTGMRLWNLRATECINRRLHVHTHAWRYGDSETIRDFQEATDWIGPEPTEIFDFDDVPKLASAYYEGKIKSYFPIYRVNGD
ncbi:quinone oxidoreductase family protein [Trinickia fusca]|uniref:Zinc-binding alcohol dehydrogenase family protein n=1 Tax=Trinickia fusca TaxID=2419777 RepID=A0A494X7F3_9BURK|nr:zinc-binding alcohol dehydrogenase family protein [Trinickia fusca]RKP46380.1 zinc-binding alcohol dehydrogenase family protein [Trinickia fusca]